MKRVLHDVRQKLSSIKYERILHIVLTNNKDCPKILHFKQKVKKNTLSTLLYAINAILY